MRRLSFALVSTFSLVLLASCAEPPAPPRPPEPPRVSVAFVGEWVRLTPRRLRGDTLRLRADSSADGIILWNDKRDALARHWVTHFGSRDPVAARADWRKGYQDGGDADCVVGRRRVGCVSMPILCLGAPGHYACNALKYVAPDSLFLADGSSFVRVPQLPRTVDRLSGRGDR
jgi:hypothetical protein